MPIRFKGCVEIFFLKRKEEGVPVLNHGLEEENQGMKRMERNDLRRNVMGPEKSGFNSSNREKEEMERESYDAYVSLTEPTQAVTTSSEVVWSCSIVLWATSSSTVCAFQVRKGILWNWESRLKHFPHAPSYSHNSSSALDIATSSSRSFPTTSFRRAGVFLILSSYTAL